jgi:hypothetical protein
MLLAIRTIAKHRILADRMGDSSNDKEIVSAASRVLVEWPRNFIALLEDIGHSFQPTSAAASAQVGGIYWGFFRNKAMGDPTQTEILRVAFLYFAMNHWGRGSVDHKIIRDLGGTGPKRFSLKQNLPSRSVCGKVPQFGCSGAIAAWAKQKGLPVTAIEIPAPTPLSSGAPIYLRFVPLLFRIWRSSRHGYFRFTVKT